MQPSRSQYGLFELQRKQADRQAKELAAATDQETLEVLKRSVNYLAGAGKATTIDDCSESCRIRCNTSAVFSGLPCTLTACSEPPESTSNISGPRRG